MISVLKYGGSSVDSVEKMKLIAQKIKSRKEKGESIVLVVSAIGKTTNQLLTLAKTAVENPNKRALDMMLATGEQVSTALIGMILEDMGVQVISLTGQQAGILTEGMHTKATIKDIQVDRIKRYLEEDYVVVVAGFQGINALGDITTLGRGGSDTTAVALAAKLGAKCMIYTDVRGIYGVDPRLYPKARRMHRITYEEMKEMAFKGAKVMETRSVEIGRQYGVPIYVASAHEEGEGTWIEEENHKMEQRSITGLSVSEHVLMVTVNNLEHVLESVSEVFCRLADEAVNVDMISQTILDNGTASLAFTVPIEEEQVVKTVVEGIFKNNKKVSVSLTKDIVKLSVVGSGMRTQSGVAAKLFQLFSKNGIGFKQVTTSEISISYTIEKAFLQRAVYLVAEAFEL